VVAESGWGRAQTEKYAVASSILPRDAMLARHMSWPCVRLQCVCHNRNAIETAQRIQLGFGTGASFNISHNVLWGNSSISKIRVLPSGTLPQTLHLENFATASRSCCQQNSSTVELVDHTYERSTRRCWTHVVYYTSVDRNPLTPLLRFLSGFVVRHVPTVVQQLTKFRRTQRGPSAVAELLVRYYILTRRLEIVRCDCPL